MAPRYFRMSCENAAGTMGHFLFEVINGMLTRAVNKYDGQLYWSTPLDCKNELYDFTDQPEFIDAEIPGLVADFQLAELTIDEFESIWKCSQ